MTKTELKQTKKEGIRNLNMSTETNIQNLLDYIKDNFKDESIINLKIYTKQKASRTAVLNYETENLDLITAHLDSYWDDSYWNVKFDIDGFIDVCQNYLNNTVLLSSELISILKKCEFEKSGDLGDVEYDMSVETDLDGLISGYIEEDDLPENLKDENNQFVPHLLMKEYDPIDNEVINNNLRSIDKIFFTNGGKEYEIKLTS